MTELKHIPVFAYVCDTSVKIFDLHPELLTFQILMVECTFWGLPMRARAHETGHIEWSELVPYIQKYPNTQFVLFHVSKRHECNIHVRYCADQYSNVYVIYRN